MASDCTRWERCGVVGPSYASIGETPAAPRFVKWGVSSRGKKAVHKRYEILMVYGDVHLSIHP